MEQAQSTSPGGQAGRPDSTPSWNHPVLKKTCALLIVGFWVLMMGFYARREWRARQTPVQHSGYAQLFRSRLINSVVQTGIYIKGERIGATLTKYGRRQENYEISSTTRLRVPLFGDDQASSLIVVMTLDPGFQLQGFTGAFCFSSIRMDFEGTVSAGVLHAVLRSGSRTVMETHVPIQDQELVANVFSPFLVAPRLRVGQRWPLRLLNPLTQTFEDAEALVEGTETLWLDGEAHDAFRVRLEGAGIEAVAWVTPDGDVLKQWIPRWQVILVKEDPDKAAF